MSHKDRKNENVCVVWCWSEENGERIRETQVWVREWTQERRTCFAAIASLHLGQNTIIVSVRGASGISHSATALSGLWRKREVPSGTGLSESAAHSSGPLCGAASLSILPAFILRLNCTRSLTSPGLSFVAGRRPPRRSDNRYILRLSCGKMLVRHSPVTRHCHTGWGN